MVRPLRSQRYSRQRVFELQCRRRRKAPWIPAHRVLFAKERALRSPDEKRAHTHASPAAYERRRFSSHVCVGGRDSGVESGSFGFNLPSDAQASPRSAQPFWLGPPKAHLARSGRPRSVISDRVFAPKVNESRFPNRFRGCRTTRGSCSQARSIASSAQASLGRRGIRQRYRVRQRYGLCRAMKRSDDSAHWRIEPNRRFQRILEFVEVSVARRCPVRFGSSVLLTEPGERVGQPITGQPLAGDRTSAVPTFPPFASGDNPGSAASSRGDFAQANSQGGACSSEGVVKHQPIRVAPPRVRAAVTKGRTVLITQAAFATMTP